MANISFKKGILKNIPAQKVEGTLYVTTDERAIYLDVDDNTRIRLGDFQEFDNVEALNANQNPSTTALYYINDINCLAKWDGSRYVQINSDTGAISIEVTGEGNAVTDASYNAATRKITLTKGETFVTEEALELALEEFETASYDIVRDEASNEYAAVYHLTKNGKNIGAAINIPKDMILKSGKVVTNPVGQNEGTYIELTLANETNDVLYVNVSDMIEYVASGSSDMDMVVIDVSDDYKITATIADKSITLAKLAKEVQDKWDEVEQNAKDYTNEQLAWGEF